MIRLEATVGQKGQAVIPKPIRDQLGIRPGDTIHFRIDGDQLLVDLRSDAEVWQAFCGALQKDAIPARVDWDAVHDEQARAVHALPAGAHARPTGPQDIAVRPAPAGVS